MGIKQWIPDPFNVLKFAAGALFVGVGGLGALLYAFQTRLIYPASMPAGSRVQVPRPSEFQLPDDEIDLTTPDGVRLKAFLLLQDEQEKPETRPTILLLHANAGNVGHRLPIAKVFYRRMRCNVLALSYRGYGRSEGSPNEKGLKLDAQTALDYIVSHPLLEKTPIFLYGQSIGGAVSIFLASQNPARVNGLIVENTFLSLPKLVPVIMPFVAPFIFLLHQIWPSEDYIRQLPATMPTLFLSGDDDELVPPSHVKELYRICPSEKKELRTFEFGSHNDTCVQPEYFTTIAAFISQHTDSSPARPSTPGASSDISAVSPPSSVTSDDRDTDGAESFGAGSFELIDREEDEQEIAREGGAVSMNPLGKTSERL